MRINHNIAAMNTYRQMTANTTATSKSLEKLSSGLKINRAGDDAAGLAISEKMRGQIRGLDTASKNASDGISLIQTAEGALNETHSILQRMRELTVQAANDTNQTTDRGQLQLKIEQLVQEINRISTTTQFNGKTLLTGSYATAGAGLNFQIGANSSQSMELLIGNMGATALNVSGIDLSGTFSAITVQISTIDTAINTVATQRARLGAVQNRLEHTINNLGTSSENLSAAESRIRDVDMAKEMMEFTKNNILSQAAQSMLAQANQQPQGVLQLLQ